MQALQKLSFEIRQYMLITANYWVFTLTDGALRMLVVLHFHQLGYSPLEIAMLFLFYEVFGVVTNLFGGWLGAHWGLNKTMNIGLILQVVALGLLLVPTNLLTVLWVMMAQALSGIAKDLNKMSAKSAIKLLVPKNADGTLYRWVAILTGSKNTLKGVGFFMGGLLLSTLGFRGALLFMMIMLLLVWSISLVKLKQELGKSKNKPKFSELLSKSKAINYLSAARLFLFGARDIWFVVALPVFLTAELNWNQTNVGVFLALWIIGYGVVQSVAPKITSNRPNQSSDSRTGFIWAVSLSITPILICLGLIMGLNANWILVLGLMVFGFIFAINSSFHSYLIVKFAQADGVSLDVGFYYMANAMGRLIGTVLSGLLFQFWGLEVCLIASAIFLIVSAFIINNLPVSSSTSSQLETNS